MGLNQTPAANRLHIGIFGKRNSGKSSLINALTGQNTAIVSDTPGTTADPVYKAMELRGIGPCVFIDTAGFDDEGELGRLRVEKTRAALSKTDVAILVFSSEDLELEKEWVHLLKAQKTPVLGVLNQCDLLSDPEGIRKKIELELSIPAYCVSAKSGGGIDEIRKAILSLIPEDYEKKSITGHLVKAGDVVMLVMPQDSEAPKGRLILPQVQTIRDLLDLGCISLNVTPETMEAALSALKEPPALIITDSQVFRTVYEKKPEQSRLTSFSVLFAGYKGDIQEFIRGAEAIERLTEQSRVLIAEACTHAPLSEDIGRVKIPAMLRKKTGPGLQVDVAAGADFPKDLSKYDLIIHCGACMFNRKYVMARVEEARGQRIPITNYGIAVAYLTGILNQIDY